MSSTKDTLFPNGLLLNGKYLPEEVLIQILSFTSEGNLLTCSLVCKKWNDIIKSQSFWTTKRQRTNKPFFKDLPWYVYYLLFTRKFFDQNLLLNSCGQDHLDHWKIITNFNFGEEWKIENPPEGTDPFPTSPEFTGQNSCFVSSYGPCAKLQIINLAANKLCKRILDEYQPDIYVSEWCAGRFESGCVYNLRVTLLNNDEGGKICSEINLSGNLNSGEGKRWHKVEHTFRNYGKGVTHIMFFHEGRDTQYWPGHYGCKISGGCVRVLFESLICKNV